MSVNSTHYVVLGVVIDNRDEVKQFFTLRENNYALFDEYHDHGYQAEITPTKSGIHVIDDGMSGEYVIVGKILRKGTGENGLGLCSISLDVDLAHHNVYPEIIQLDQKLGTNFRNLDVKIIAVTHWH